MPIPAPSSSPEPISSPKPSTCSARTTPASTEARRHSARVNMNANLSQMQGGRDSGSRSHRGFRQRQRERRARDREERDRPHHGGEPPAVGQHREEGGSDASDADRDPERHAGGAPEPVRQVL